MSNTELKTIRDFINEFPEPFKTQALANVKTCQATVREEAPVEILISVPAMYGQNPFSALIAAFIWSISPEGSEYWVKFASTLEGAPNEEQF